MMISFRVILDKDKEQEYLGELGEKEEIYISNFNWLECLRIIEKSIGQRWGTSCWVCWISHGGCVGAQARGQRLREPGSAQVRLLGLLISQGEVNAK